MYAQKGKPKENKSSVIANSPSQEKSGGKQHFSFVDNRPTAVAQRKVQEIANIRPQTKQAAQSEVMSDINSSEQQQHPTQKTIQRVMTPAAFVANSPAPNDRSIFSKGRNKVRRVDNQLAAYRAIPFRRAAAKRTALEQLITECDTYIAFPDNQAKRKAGVKMLKDEATKELFLVKAADLRMFGVPPAQQDLEQVTRLYELVDGRADELDLRGTLLPIIYARMQQLTPARKDWLAEGGGRNLLTALLSGTVHLGLVGESHGEIDDVEERKSWRDAGIGLMYENETSPEGIRPDQPVNKVLFAWKRLEESFGKLKAVHGYIMGAAGVKNAADKTSIANALWEVEYLLNPMYYALKEMVDDPITPAIRDEAGAISELVMELAQLFPDEGESSTYKDIAEIKNGLPKIFVNMQKMMAGQGIDTGKTGDEYSEQRAGAMLAGASQIAAARDKFIYKIGNNHVKEINAAGWAVPSNIMLLDKKDYTSEYRILRGKLALSRLG